MRGFRGDVVTEPVGPIGNLYLMWNVHITASALYHRTLREEMDVRGADLPNIYLL